MIFLVKKKRKAVHHAVAAVMAENGWVNHYDDWLEARWNYLPGFCFAHISRHFPLFSKSFRIPVKLVLTIDDHLRIVVDVGPNENKDTREQGHTP